MEQLALPFSLRDQWIGKVRRLREEQFKMLSAYRSDMKFFENAFDRHNGGFTQEEMLKNVRLSKHGYICWG